MPTNDTEGPGTLTEEDRRHVAVHEAGHAVVARVLGLSCERVTVVRNVEEGHEGFALMPDHWATVAAWEERGKFRDVTSAVNGRMVANMAGAEAEVILLGSTYGGDGNDRYWINVMADSSDSRYGDPEEWQRYEPRMRRQTRRLIRKHRAAIERVAAALLERQTLGAEEIDSLLAVRGAA